MIELNNIDVNEVILKLKIIITYASMVPAAIVLGLLIFWALNTSVFLNFTRKRLRRLKENCIDGYTIKLRQNVQFNYYKFSMVIILIIIEMSALIFPVVNHVIYDKHFNSQDSLVCIEGCCLKNWTFVDEIERLGKYKYLSCLIDSLTFVALFCAYCLFAIIMLFCQFAYIEKKEERKKLVRSIKWMIATLIPSSLILLVLLALPQTILLGSLIYAIVSLIFIPIILMYYKKLKRMRRQHLTDLVYECYNDTSLLNREAHNQKWAEIGAEFIISTMGILQIFNIFEMIFIRIVSTFILNPCWFKLTYSVDININTELSISDTNILLLIENINYLLKALLLFLILTGLVIIHIIVITDKMRTILKKRREKEQDLIKKLIEQNYSNVY
ncbi:hypothetical protein LOD99_12808 [Oopsacas minuta]|uniref:G-protein coupled receptors family 1 profile domain-containing protein n=1 Tax=Oopsacas minuta TaxID=111878 RepID=A0AAV7JD32_9METZ|nr:hypothetical protein LOD99_12808 [Oopsacas minuta]